MESDTTSATSEVSRRRTSKRCGQVPTGSGTRVTFKPDRRDLHGSRSTTTTRSPIGSGRWPSSTRASEDHPGGRAERRNRRSVRSTSYDGGLAEYVAVPPWNSRQAAARQGLLLRDREARGGDRAGAPIRRRASRENTHTFVNNINTHEGGIAPHGASRRLSRARSTTTPGGTSIFKKDEGLSGDDVREGSDVRPQRPGHGAPVRGADQDQAREQRGPRCRRSRRKRAPVNIFLDENPRRPAKAIIEKSLQAARAREAARKARDLARKKSALEGGVLAWQARRLFHFGSRRLCELYLVEGDSAGGLRQTGSGPVPTRRSYL